MTRKRWIYPSDGSDPYEVSPDFVQPNSNAPMVVGDLPGYLSPSGVWVEGRAARREDLRRANCRPWEGLEQEKKEAARQQRYAEEKRETSLDRAAHEAYYQLSPSKRDALKWLSGRN